jgi:hypothetical protein
MNGTIANNVLAVGRRNATGVQLLGTCFAVSENLFATPAHVPGPVDKDLCVVLPSIKNLQEYQDTTNTTVTIIDVRLAQYDPVRDIAILSGIASGLRMTYSYCLGGSDSASTGASVFFARVSSRRSRAPNFDRATKFGRGKDHSRLPRNKD